MRSQYQKVSCTLWAWRILRIIDAIYKVSRIETNVDQGSSDHSFSSPPPVFSTEKELSSEEVIAKPGHEEDGAWLHLCPTPKAIYL